MAVTQDHPPIFWYGRPFKSGQKRAVLLFTGVAGRDTPM